MSPQRVADAASISPYPFVVRQERQPAPAPSQPPPGSSSENAERARPLKGKKKPKPPRVVEEEIRFNTGPPRVVRPPQANRGRRGFRFPGRTYPEDQNGIPDYPPPSFQEAINTPPLSVSSSMVSLVQPTTLPLIFPQDIPEHPHEPPISVVRTEARTAPVEPATLPPTDGAAETEDGASDSDESLFIIDPHSVPFSSTDLPRGAELTKRVHTDWKTRRGVEFPGRFTPAEAAARGRQALKLDIGAQPALGDGAGNGNASPTASPKRRFLSLSPLRTIFPAKSPAHQDRAMSAHPSPSSSPYSASRSTFFRSTSSLATSFLPLLPSAAHKSESLSRRIFAAKSKERARATPERLEAWEVLDEETYENVDKDGVEHPASLMAAIASMRKLAEPQTSPTRSQSFTFGTQVPHTAPATTTRFHQSYVHPREAVRAEAAPESPSRDWKGPSTAFIDRPVHRRPPTSPSMVSVVSGSNTVSSAPMSMIDLPLANARVPPVVLEPVRLRTTAPSPPPSLAHKHTAHVVHSSPLRDDAKPNIKINSQEVGAALYQRALETPLPATPPLGDRSDVDDVPHAGYSGPDADVMRDSMPDNDSAPFLSRTSPQLTIAVQQHLQSTTPAIGISGEEPMTPNRHHYAGRPLPRPPPTPGRAATVDSTYAAPAESASMSWQAEHAQTFGTCPEGLLIDLDDTTLDDITPSGASTPRSDAGFFPYARQPMSQSASSVNLSGDSSFFSMQGASTPRRAGTPGMPHQPHHAGVFSELTDLDLLVAELDDRASDGTDYETLLLVSELIGPASPPRPPGAEVAVGAGASGARTGQGTWGARRRSPSPSANIPLIGRIEEARRRTTATGRVKVKLTLLDVVVNNCGICLAQFRDGERAALTACCRNAFHEVCIARWVARARTCPLCRVPLDADDP